MGIVFPLPYAVSFACQLLSCQFNVKGIEAEYHFTLLIHSPRSCLRFWQEFRRAVVRERCGRDISSKFVRRVSISVFVCATVALSNTFIVSDRAQGARKRRSFIVGYGYMGRRSFATARLVRTRDGSFLPSLKERVASQN